MAKQTKLLTKVTFIATVFALLVVGLGAFTRLTDAGLGCPDWPGCYGQIAVPSSASAIRQAEIKYPGQTVVAHKAWAEMVHRYVAGTLGLLIVGILALVIKTRQRDKVSLALAVSLIVVVLYQALLGAWTVTMKLLPLVVSGHLIGGMLILSLLWLLHLRSRDSAPVLNSSLGIYKMPALIGLFIVFLQIMLGAWTSTNYAALSCMDFPYCNGSLVPALDFKDAFNVFSPLGVNYEGGVLGAVSRQTIHFMHRFGALITTVYVGGLVFAAMTRAHSKSARRVAGWVLLILSAQVMLGILNVVLQLPLVIAVAHNLFAALLLLSMVTFNYVIAKETLPFIQGEMSHG